MTAPKTDAKFKTPSPFSGDRTEFSNWIQEVELYLLGNGVSEDQTKILFALSYMTGGPAGAWKNTFFTSATDADNFGTWADFKKKLVETFKEGDSAEIANNQLDLLVQGNSNAEDYTAVFETIWAKTGLTDEAEKIRKYKKGLNRPLREKVETKETVPNTYAKYKDSVLKFDRAYLRFKDAEGLSASKKISPIKFARRPAPFTQYLGTRPTDGHGRVDSYHPSVSDRMDTRLDAIPKPLSAQEMDRLRREGKCFHCKKTGHISRDCPNKRGRNTRTFRRPLNVKAAYEEIAEIYRSISKEEQDELAEMANEKGF